MRPHLRRTTDPNVLGRPLLLGERRAAAALAVRNRMPAGVAGQCRVRGS